MIKEFLQGRFMKHPLHPMLVHLPIGLWVASFILDLVFMGNGNANYAVASYYCILIGFIGALLAAVPGFAEYSSIPRDTQARRLGTLHLSLNLVITVLYILNFVARRAPDGGAPGIVTGGQFILSLFSIVLLSISGYIGGLLVYNYGIGFKPQLRDQRHTERRDRVA